MNEKQYARVQKVDVAPYERAIFISDVHGCADMLDLLLKKIRLTPDDVLFFLGDHIEKGPESLRALRTIMELCEGGNAYALLGNCDTVWDDLIEGRYNVDINGYIDLRKNSVLADMCAQSGIDRQSLGDEELRRELEARYSAELGFLRSLPHIIDAGEFILVHAGMDGEDISAQTPERCLKRFAFMEEPQSFSRYVVAGHMVVSNYAAMVQNKLFFHPLIDRWRRMISIDGGASIKMAAQLNALIYDVEDARFSFETADLLPTALAFAPQSESPEWGTVVWNHNEVEAIETHDDMTLCRVRATGAVMEIPNSLLFTAGGKLRAYDYTTYQPRLAPGDVVSIVEPGEKATLIKRNGVLGWADSAILTHS